MDPDSVSTVQVFSVTQQEDTDVLKYQEHEEKISWSSYHCHRTVDLLASLYPQPALPVVKEVGQGKILKEGKRFPATKSSLFCHKKATESS